jgi:hypothetical protein
MKTFYATLALLAGGVLAAGPSLAAPVGSTSQRPATEMLTTTVATFDCRRDDRGCFMRERRVTCRPARRAGAPPAVGAGMREGPRWAGGIGTAPLATSQLGRFKSTADQMRRVAVLRGCQDRLSCLSSGGPSHDRADCPRGQRPSAPYGGRERQLSRWAPGGTGPRRHAVASGQPITSAKRAPNWHFGSIHPCASFRVRTDARQGSERGGDSTLTFTFSSIFRFSRAGVPLRPCSRRIYRPQAPSHRLS